MLLMRYCSHRFPIPCEKRLTNFSRRSWLAAARGNLSYSFAQNGNMDVSLSNNSTFSGMEDVLMGYIFGKEKATKVAHLVWKHVVQKGDTVVDATCGNGYDTLAMLKMVADGSGRGCVYGMDIQKDALENTSSLLNESVNPIESGYQRCKKFNAPRKELVKLFTICHSRMEEVVPKSTTLRLVAFNLGYLPGGDKEVTTTSATTILALQAATRILASGGLISLVVYVGHPGGREELETIQAFASELSVEDWVCSEFQMLNRPLAPVLIFLFKR